MKRPNSCPNPNRQDIFLDWRAQEHRFHPAGDFPPHVCCQKCSLYSSISCTFAPCRYFERVDKLNGYFTQVAVYTPKRRTR